MRYQLNILVEKMEIRYILTEGPMVWTAGGVSANKGEVPKGFRSCGYAVVRK